MANQLKMATVQAVFGLHQRGWSNRRIARELGIHRETVARYVDLARRQAKPANPPPGSADAESLLPAPVDGEFAAWGPPAEGSDSGPASQCEPHRQIIQSKLDQGLSGQRIYQDLVADHEFVGSYDSVKRFVRRLREATPLPFRRMECEPGHEAQVDFGTGAPIVSPEGKRKRSHVLRVILSHSRKGFSQALFRQTTDAFIRCLEDAFRHFGGVTQTVVIDNLKAAVNKADWYDPDLHPKIRAFCEYYGTTILPTRPYTPRHKGKVENGIEYVQSNGLKGHKFPTLAAENRHLLDWETNIADTRIHGTTRKQVRKVFQEVEKPALLLLPAGRFPFFEEAQRSVHRDGHIEVAKAYYSVPAEYSGSQVWARWDGRMVRIFDQRMKQIATHVQHEPGQFSTRAQDISPKKISGVERGNAWLLGRIRLIGPAAHRWAWAMLQERGIEGVRVLLGLLNLANRYLYEDIDAACEIALTHRAFRLRTLRELIKRGGSKQEEFEFLNEHEIIRPMDEYGDLAGVRFWPAAATEP